MVAKWLTYSECAKYVSTKNEDAMNELTICN